MSDIKKIIDEAILNNKAIIGFRESYKALKRNELKTIIVAKNMEEEKMEDIKYNAKIYNVELIIFQGSSRELGILCGKPYVISAIGVKK